MSTRFVEFGPWEPGTASSAVRIPVSWLWSDLSTSISGPAPEDFSSAVDSGYPGEPQTVSATFQPTAYGTRDATLTITGWWTNPFDPNDPGHWVDRDVPLTGYGLCPGDLDGDAEVRLSDLAVLLSNYDAVGLVGYQDGDINRDMRVDLNDLAALLAVYDTSCP
jgi:hypothetical protein